MHLLVDISAHGLGHLAQTAPVVAALKARLPGLRLTLRSALARQQLARRIDAEFAHVAAARDFGFVMHNAVDVDLAASANAYRAFHCDWPQRVAAEAAWLNANGIDAVLTNVAYLPLAAAAAAGLPAACLCSLNWADLFRHYFPAEDWAAEIHAQMTAAYRDADCFLRVTPGLPMTQFERRRDIAPIARRVRRDRAALARQLGLDAGRRWVLLAMGGMEFRLPVASWPQTPGLTWLVPAAWQVQRDDVCSFDAPGVDFGDVLASADAVVTKPGYGTFVEAACAGVPILYLERGDWLETTHFAAWLAVHARSCELPRQRLLRGEFVDAMTQLWNAPAPALPSAGGADEAAAVLQAVFARTRQADFQER
ncbi:MAG: hypothetical protein HZC24_14175 [Rhodocyclales bacterium]|nr:hypothetical protein [Rhodocyclales bacterium]